MYLEYLLSFGFSVCVLTAVGFHAIIQSIFYVTIFYEFKFGDTIYSNVCNETGGVIFWYVMGSKKKKT